MSNTCFDPADPSRLPLDAPSPDVLPDGLADPFRRRLLGVTTLAGGVLAAGVPLRALAESAGRAGGSLLDFAAIPVSREDRVSVAAGHRVELLFAWGDPLSEGPQARADAGDSAAEQRQQAGMHHDGLHFFPFIEGGLASSAHGLLCINHEYTDDGLLHRDGMEQWSADKVAKSKAATGISIIEVRRSGGAWRVVRPSRWARRITADTPCRIGGPARGDAALRTAADPRGEIVLGTINNCAMGVTPWGTYLSCEENFNGYFRAPAAAGSDFARYGFTENGFGYRWHEFDERFDAGRHPNEANRFGWVLEVDPWHPERPPVKRTALGRFKHEGATVTLAADRRVVVYMGDDERFEYVYKYVSRRPHVEGGIDHDHLLDDGTLYVARFDGDGSGRWLPLRHGERHAGGTLDAASGFPDQAAVLVRCRQAADLAGATRMDRPEWIAVHPRSGEVYVTLTNNARRGAAGAAAPDAANPRPQNVFGHIVRWREDGADAAALSFAWDIFALAGDPGHADPARRGTIRGDAYGSPDGLWFDASGRLWIQTDVAAAAMNRGDYERLGNNQMLAADPATGETRRFLSGPVGCEVTGVTATPDGRSLFVNIQHPGESPNERSDPSRPLARSAWPSSQFPAAVGGRPRSATVVITRNDGGPVAA